MSVPQYKNMEICGAVVADCICIATGSCVGVSEENLIGVDEGALDTGALDTGALDTGALDAGVLGVTGE